MNTSRAVIEATSTKSGGFLPNHWRIGRHSGASNRASTRRTLKRRPRDAGRRRDGSSAGSGPGKSTRTGGPGVPSPGGEEEAVQERIDSDGLSARSLGSATPAYGRRTLPPSLFSDPRRPCGRRRLCRRAGFLEFHHRRLSRRSERWSRCLENCSINTTLALDV